MSEAKKFSKKKNGKWKTFLLEKVKVLEKKLNLSKIEKFSTKTNFAKKK